MLGRTFLMLVHLGRKSGQPHDIVAMVLSEDPETGEVASMEPRRPVSAQLT
jgi:hypothetical protein